jgi:hypothetical protein
MSRGRGFSDWRINQPRSARDRGIESLMHILFCGHEDLVERQIGGHSIGFCELAARASPRHRTGHGMPPATNRGQLERIFDLRTILQKIYVGIALGLETP